MPDATLSSNEFKALSSDARTQLLKHLKERNHTLTELAKKTGKAAPSVKEHLDVLVAAGFIQLNDEGRKWKYYALTRKGKSVLGSEENKTAFLIILGASSIALVGVLLLLANSLQGYPGLAETAPATEAPALAAQPMMAKALQAPAPENAPAAGAAQEAAASAVATGPSPAPAPEPANRDAYAYLAIALGLSAFIGFQAGRLRRKAI